jgi:hypothetical protein
MIISKRITQKANSKSKLATKHTLKEMELIISSFNPRKDCSKNPEKKINSIQNLGEMLK